jgi:hypothetical protein
MNVQFNLIRHPELLLDLPRLIFLAFEEHIKGSTTFPSIFVTDNREFARKANGRTDLSGISDFDVAILVIDSEDDHSDSLVADIHQIEVREFGDMLHAILDAYK